MDDDFADVLAKGKPVQLKARLNGPARAVVLLAFAALVTLSTAVGYYTGVLSGFQTAEPIFNRPTTPIGLAPDIGPAVEGVMVILGHAALGTLLGVTLGALIALAGCRVLLVPALRRHRWATSR